MIDAQTEERRSRYLRLAAEIKKLAHCDARLELREHCLIMVGSWLQLATEIEARQRAAAARGGSHGHSSISSGPSAFPCPACGSGQGFAGGDPAWPDALIGSACSSCGYKLTAAELKN